MRCLKKANKFSVLLVSIVTGLRVYRKNATGKISGDGLPVKPF